MLVLHSAVVMSGGIGLIIAARRVLDRLTRLFMAGKILVGGHGDPEKEQQRENNCEFCFEIVTGFFGVGHFESSCFVT